MTLGRAPPGPAAGAPDVGVNAPRMLYETKLYLIYLNNWSDEETHRRVVYMPNYYPKGYVSKRFDYDKDFIKLSILL